MMRYLFSGLLSIAALSASAFSQTTPSANADPAPTPKPAVKRRTFDQFDLNNGISIESGRNTTGVRKVATDVEFLDQQTYDGFVKLVEYVTTMETDYRSTADIQYDPLDREQPERVLNRKLNATFRLTQLFSEGLLDHSRFKNQANLNLLSESQTVIVEALAVAAVTGDWARNERKLAELAVKYNASGPSSGEAVDKRAILTAMLGRLSGNLTQLKDQIAVGK